MFASFGLIKWSLFSLWGGRSVGYFSRLAKGKTQEVFGRLSGRFMVLGFLVLPSLFGRCFHLLFFTTPF